MSETHETAATDPVADSEAGLSAPRTIKIVFEFAQSSELMTGQRIRGFPSAVLGGNSIVIDPLPQGIDKTALQAAINRRTADLATVTQALALALSQLADAISEINQLA